MKNTIGKTGRKIIAAALASAMVLSAGVMTGLSGTEGFPGAGITADAAEEDYSYTVNDDGTVTITGYYGYDTYSLNVPSTLGGKKVTGIGVSAFDGKNWLRRITLPDTVNTIGAMAFYECEDLITVNIPEGVKELGFRTFYGCKSLEDITIPESVESIGGGCFYGCECLYTVNIPHKVTIINDRTFYNCSALNYIVLPMGLEIIGIDAFMTCPRLGDVYIPETVENIDPHAFHGCINLIVHGKKGSYAEKYMRTSEYGTFREYQEPVCYASLSAEEILLGERLSVTMSGTGGMGILSLAVYYKKETDKKWYTLQDFNHVNSQIFFRPGKAVKYDLCVKVRDEFGTVVKKYMKFTVRPTLSNVSTVSSNTVPHGEAVTVNAKAEGGKGGYTYAVYYKKSSDSTWAIKQNYKENPTVSVVLKRAVKYDICVKVKDSSGKIVKKYMTVTGV